MNIKKKRGLRIEPCGTPNFINSYIDSALLYFTFCDRFEK
jgi:hypothetical protein